MPSKAFGLHTLTVVWWGCLICFNFLWACWRMMSGQGMDKNGHYKPEKPKWTSIYVCLNRGHNPHAHATVILEASGSPLLLNFVQNTRRRFLCFLSGGAAESGATVPSLLSSTGSPNPTQARIAERYLSPFHSFLMIATIRHRFCWMFRWLLVDGVTVVSFVRF